MKDNADFWQSAYQQHGSSILAYLRVRTGSTEEAEDLLQETFVRAIAAGDTINDMSRLRSFLFSTAHHLFLNPLRGNKRIGNGPAGDVALEDLVAADGTEARVQSRAFQTRLEAVLREMTPKLRRAFELAVIMGEPYAEIAHQTGWSLPTVKINVYRARKQAVSRLGDFI